MKPAIFFDRDGVINEVILVEGKPFSPRDIKDFHLIKGVELALDQFKNHGFVNIIVTNQPDIARNLMSLSMLEEMNKVINNNLAIDDIYYCPHDNADNCLCRKPKPGMLVSAAKKWDLDIKKSYLIGDNYKDIQAAKSAGCGSILIDAVYNNHVECQKRVKTLNEALDYILIKVKIQEGQNYGSTKES